MADINQNSLGPILTFQELSKAEVRVAAKEIIRNNNLTGTIDSFVRRAKQSFLILRAMNGDFHKIVSIGLKGESPKILASIISSKMKFIPPEGEADTLQQFLDEARSGKVIERGWATNTTGLKGALHTLTDEFEKHLKQIGKTRSSTFCTVESSNGPGAKSAIKSGYVCVGQFPSPYSKNVLKLFIWPAVNKADQRVRLDHQR